MTTADIIKQLERQAAALEKSAQRTSHDSSRQILKGHAAALRQLASEVAGGA